ncbi:hypothetical protein ACIPYQ_11495 [Streptomyces sp. NPDC090045]|uniref:hypothetical protein n=1 Tax=Streptomyces sp. NPDC090045 TaxID=3365927 RepID=UPI00380DE1A3
MPRRLFRTIEYPNLPILERLATTTGKGNFFRLADHGLNGAYALDLLCTKRS